jgi:EAL domain-containing protein (putative c-di-GMP-specific phosphodiesterase class I)/GGDEF domain-containing protein
MDIAHDPAARPSPLAALTTCAVGRTAPWRTKVAAALAVLALLLIAAGIVFLSGGTRYSYVHVTYVPIIAAAFFFGLRGGLAAGIAAGLVMGPFMPLDVQAWTYQDAGNWLTRTGFFVLIGSFSGMATDNLRRQLQTIRHSVYYDQLTKLPNRALCLEKLRHLIDARQSETATALAVGLGSIEAVIAALSHEYADKLHKSAAQRLERLLPEGVELFSFGSGLFVALFSAPPEEVRKVALQMARSLDERFDIDGVPILSSGHAGLAICATSGGDAQSLLRGCVSAFQDAVSAKQDLATYDDRLHSSRRSKLRLMPDLQEAICTGEGITLHYQPVLDLKTGQCLGAEALIRWTHPTHGPLPPADFIAAAEQTALIRPLTRLVLNLALDQLREWQVEGLHLQLSVNISIRDLEDEDFPATVSYLLDKFGVAPSRLNLEVTETALMTSADVVLETLDALRKLGISIALDDFGVGQSSLSYLSGLPADVLKLDRAFAQDLETNPRAEVVIRAAVEAAHALGQKVVAEGIERLEVLDALRRISCDFAQGYLLSRPLPENQFRAWLIENRQQIERGAHILSPGALRKRNHRLSIAQ